MSIAAFRCDASPQMGTGHVMRCLSLAHSLAEKSFKIAFLCSEETPKTVSALQESGFEICHDDTYPKADWLIIDHYDLDSTYESSARSWAKNVLVIDDLADRKHDCDILLDQTYGRLEDDYKDLVSPDCHILTGAQYALLLPVFAKKRQHVDRDFSGVQRVLISFGGVNPKEATERTLSMVQKYKDKALIFDVVSSVQAHNLSGIQDTVQAINAERFHTATLHIDIPDMADLMVQADLCIGAGGTTSWERCCLKLPTLTMEVADNQKTVLEKLAKVGAIHHLGAIEDLDQGTFLKAFSDLMVSADRLEELSTKAASICRGDGVSRLLCFMMESQSTKSGQMVTLHLAGDDDCDQLLAWQEIPEIRKHARNPDIPSKEKHQAWFEASLENPERYLFIINCEGQAAGMARLDKANNKEFPEGSYEVSIFVGPAFQGQGVALSALSLLRQYMPCSPMVAEVLPDNDASHKLFDQAGYRLINETWYIHEPHEKEGQKRNA